MSWGRPIVRVVSARSGKDALAALDGLWSEVSVTLNEGGESDEAELTLIGPPSRVPLPKKGDEYQVLMGWEHEGGAVDQGTYTVQKVSARGTPGAGETIVVTMRAAALDDKAKAIGRQHYDEDETLGDRLSKVAGKAGATAVVDPQLASIKLPYALRLDQSPIDFARELAEANGGVLKVASKRWIVTRRSEAKGGGGSDLEPIRIVRRRAYGYDVEIDARGDYRACCGAWRDGKDGKRKLVKAIAEGARDGATHILPHLHKSEAAAKKAAEAWLKEQAAATGAGHFDCPGLPRARAGAKAIVEGFGAGLDGEWRAKKIVKTATAGSGGGFRTTVHVDAGKEPKGAKRRT